MKDLSAEKILKTRAGTNCPSTCKESECPIASKNAKYQRLMNSL